MESEKLLTADEVAAVLNVSRKSVYKWAEAGRLPFIRLGGRVVRFDPGAVRQFIESGRRNEEVMN